MDAFRFSSAGITRIRFEGYASQPRNYRGTPNGHDKFIVKRKECQLFQLLVRGLLIGIFLCT